jgi:hypothetical protein
VRHKNYKQDRWKIFLLIDVATSLDRSATQNEAERKLKYRNLSVEIQRMWNIKSFFIPVIIGCTGIVIKGLKKSENNTRMAFRRFSTKEKADVLGTLHIIRKMTATS